MNSTIKFILWGLLFSSYFLHSTTKITVEITGWNDKPLFPSRWEIQKTGGTTIYSNNSNTQGISSMKIKESGYYLIRYSGVNHLTDSIMIYLPNNAIGSLNFKAKLEPITVKNNVKPTLHIRTEKKNFSAQFNYSTEGYYYFDLPTQPNTDVCYEVGDIVPKRYVNGTFQDYYEYDNGGDWWSCFKAKDTITKIILDFNKYPSKWNEFTCTVNNIEINRFIKIYRKSIQVRNKIINFLSARTKPVESLPDSLSGIIGIHLKEIEDSLKKYRDNVFVRELLYIDYLFFSYIVFKYPNNYTYDIEVLKKIFKYVSPKSTLWLDWAQQPGIILALLLMLKETDSTEYVDKVLSENPSPYIKTKLARDAVDLYLGLLGDKISGQKYSKYLVEKFPETEEAKYVKRIYGVKLNLDSAYTSWKELFLRYELPLISDNQKFKLSELRNKYVLIDIWATWCAPCVRQIPTLTKAYQKYRNELEIVSISFDNNIAQLREYIKNKQNKGSMNWILGIEKDGFGSDIGKQLGLKGIPFLLLLDKEFNVVAYGLELNEYNLLGTLEKIFGY